MKYVTEADLKLLCGGQNTPLVLASAPIAAVIPPQLTAVGTASFLAANAAATALVGNLHAADFDRLADQLGYEGRSVDGVELPARPEGRHGDAVAPWDAGRSLAQTLRQRERLGDAAITDDRLARMAGVSESALASNGRAGAPFSFGLASESTRWRAVFRTQRRTGRRFDLARMIGDRLLAEAADRLNPATETATWRQQAQRAFAAEFLAPIQSIRERLGGDNSLESQHDVADQFIVSPLAINSQLKNHRLLPREEAFEDLSRFVV
jgi:hypothetical protein